MEHNTSKRLLSLLLLLAMLTAALPSALGADSGNLYVTGYTLTNGSGGSISSIKKGDIVNITVSIKDTSSPSTDVGTLDVTKLEDSFTGGSAVAERTSEPDKPLVYAVKLTGLQYKGTGQNLRLQVGIPGDPASYQTLELTITEAVVYDPSAKPPELPPLPPEPIPAPMVLVSRSDIKEPLEAGQEISLTITFQNLSNTTLKSPVATFTPSDGLTISGGSSSFTMKDIGGKKTGSVVVKIKANSTIPSPAQSLGVDLKFNYYNNVSLTQGTISDKVSIPALARESVPQPVVLVTRSPMEAPIAPDSTADVTIYFQNTSSAKLVKPVVSVTSSESLVVMNDAATFLLPDIEAGKTASIQVKVKALKNLTATTQTLSTELKYGYDNGGTLTQVSSSDKVVIPALAKESIPQPVVLVTRSGMDRPINPGETVSLTLTFQNAGSTKLISPVASVTPSDSLVVMNDTSTFLLPDIGPGENAAILVKVKASKDLSSATQSLSTELKYSYDNGETITQATATDRINLSANVTSKSDQSVPNLVIRSFSYGGESVAAGTKFPLDFSFENTGAAKVENVVVTIDGGESFAMDGSTNTYFYRSLAAGGTQTQQVPMRVVPTGKSGAQSISVSFKYEYNDGEKRTQATSDIKLSIPVYQPDRFQINEPTVPEYGTVGEEIEVILAYVNKGKDDIANLEATVVGEDVDTPARTQYLGNVTAGANGNVGFAISPNKAGEINVVLKITYENADQQLQTREFPIKLTAEEYVPPVDDGGDFAEDGNGISIPWLPILLAAGAAAAVIVVVVVVRKKKASQLPAVDSESWDDWDDGNNGSGEE